MLDMDLWGIWLYYTANEYSNVVRHPIENWNTDANKEKKGFSYVKNEEGGVYDGED